MNVRERILAVYRGETPDVVPYMLDLSHWYYHKHRLPWDLSKTYDQPEFELIDYHRRKGVGFYVPNLGSFYTTEYPAEVQVDLIKGEVGGHPALTWRYRTPQGEIARTRIWHEHTYSWHIAQWAVKNENGLRVLSEVLGRATFRPMWERYQPWLDAVGDGGVVYLLNGYSAMGHLLSYWMGIEKTIMATYQWPDLMHEVVDRINANLLKLIDLLAQSPAEVILMGDNFSGDVQPPKFFREWSHSFYAEAIRRLHNAGKFVGVHIDGRLRGAIEMIRDAGADCGDAITPTPTGDLDPETCRDVAGPDFILSGGVPPALWLPNVDVEDFKKSVLRWLELRRRSPRLIANAGDQVPPGADEDRIEIMRDLVEQHGKY